MKINEKQSYKDVYDKSTETETHEKEHVQKIVTK